MTAAGNLVLLGLIYAVVGLGLVSILRWTLGRLVGQLRASFELFARAVPLLMIFSVVLFLTNEVWQVFTTVEPAVAGDPDRPVRPSGDELPRRAPAARGAGPRARGGCGGAASRPPRARERRAGDVREPGAPGALREPRDRRLLRRAWRARGRPGDHRGLDGERAQRHHRVRPLRPRGDPQRGALARGGAIAAFTGLYFAISMLTDDVYRREFLEELTSEMRESFCERAEYLRLRERTAEAHRSAAYALTIPRPTSPPSSSSAPQELGDKPALIDGPSGRTVTYAELDQATRALAAGLAARGFGPGDCALRLHAEPARVRDRVPRRRARRRQGLDRQPALHRSRAPAPARGLRVQVPADDSAVPGRGDQGGGGGGSRGDLRRRRGRRRDAAFRADGRSRGCARRRHLGRRPRGPAVLERHDRPARRA